jgi:hypothetical protein
VARGFGDSYPKGRASGTSNSQRPDGRQSEPYPARRELIKVSSVSRPKKLEKRGEVGGRESDETAQ